MNPSHATLLPPLPSEQLLIDELVSASFSECLVVSPGRGQIGWHAKTLCPTGQVTLWYVDSFRAAQAQSSAHAAQASVRIVCEADPDDTPIDLALIPVLSRGEAEMTRDTLQAAHLRLSVGGTMITAVNAPRDRWLRDQMQVLFEKVSCKITDKGCVYTAVKRGSLKKAKNFDAEVVFRHRDRLLTLRTRPSVFAHRSIDVAARQLIHHGDVQAGHRVLDFGCGSGAVALAAAMDAGKGTVFAVDSNTRSVQCTRWGGITNGIDNLSVILNHDGRLPMIHDVDRALLNPPYYADFAIAEHFLNTSIGCLRPGGLAIVVTKQVQGYLDRAWSDAAIENQFAAGNYQILRFRKNER